MWRNSNLYLTDVEKFLFIPYLRISPTSVRYKDVEKFEFIPYRCGEILIYTLPMWRNSNLYLTDVEKF